MATLALPTPSQGCLNDLFRLNPSQLLIASIISVHHARANILPVTCNLWIEEMAFGNKGAGHCSRGYSYLW
jgi:hypothetical protein